MPLAAPKQPAIRLSARRATSRRAHKCTSPRIGRSSARLVTEWRFAPNWKLATEVAWLPYVNLNAKDRHLLRTDLFGSTPEKGIDALTSVQLEAVLSYYFTDAFSVGLGVRYWNLRTGSGNVTVHFEETIIEGGPQGSMIASYRVDGPWPLRVQMVHGRSSSRRGKPMQIRFGLFVAGLLASATTFQGEALAQPLFQPWLAPTAGGLPPSFRTPREREQANPSRRGQPNRALPFGAEPSIAKRHGIPPHFQRQQVDYQSSEPAGTIIIDTANTYLYLVLGNGKALRYGIGVGREGFTWSGRQRITRMAEWPNWRPPAEMLAREPHLPDFTPGGPNNPLGARALYLGHTLYRIHGTNEPATIGTYVSSGCIRLLNEDIMDLYQRVAVGTDVVVLPNDPSVSASSRQGRVN